MANKRDFTALGLVLTPGLVGVIVFAALMFGRKPHEAQTISIGPGLESTGSMIFDVIPLPDPCGESIEAALKAWVKAHSKLKFRVR